MVTSLRVRLMHCGCQVVRGPGCTASLVSCVTVRTSFQGTYARFDSPIVYRPVGWRVQGYYSGLFQKALGLGGPEGGAVVRLHNQWRSIASEELAKDRHKNRRRHLGEWQPGQDVAAGQITDCQQVGEQAIDGRQLDRFA